MTKPCSDTSPPHCTQHHSTLVTFHTSTLALAAAQGESGGEREWEGEERAAASAAAAQQSTAHITTHCFTS